jgi:hypothetical protein
VFNDLKRSLKPNEFISSYWTTRLSQSIYLHRSCIFLEAAEVDLTIGLVHDSYRRWERGRRFLLWMKISCCLVQASCALLIELE